MPAALRKPEPRYNERYLADLLEALQDATMAEAIAYYERLDPEGAHGHMGDDWLLAELGKEDLFFLLLRVLNRQDIAHPWLYERCREVEADPDGNLDLWARFHYKSTIITFALSIQDIVRDPEVTIGIFSHNRPTAKAFMRQIKNELEANETLKALYPDILFQDPKKESPKWSEDEGIVVRRRTNPKEATVEAWGLVDGMPTSKHFKIRVYDDIVTETSVGSPGMMEKTTRALELSYALGTEDGVERDIGTRYHFNDSYRTMIERGSVKVRLHNGTRENSGDIKRPVLWTKEFMAKMRKKMGPYTFACQILQNPKADATHGFQREWLERWTPDDGQGLNKYILVDAANSKKDTADYTAAWVVGLGEDENVYVLDILRDRLNLTERTAWLLNAHRKWKPIEVRYEEYGLQSDIEHIQDEQTRQKYRFKITKVGGVKISKEDRIKRLIPFFENHRIILPHQLHASTVDHETVDVVHVFVEQEYMAFPVPVHDDMLDALARIAEPDGHVDGKKVKLTLKFPAKRKPIVVPERHMSDPGAGY